MRAEDVEDAVAVLVRALEPVPDDGWSAPAGPLEWSCRDTAVHVADDLFGYAAQVALAPSDRYPPFEIVVPEGVGTAGLLQVVATGGAMLAAAVRTAPPGVRGWHPFGDADAAGFAAMGVVEVLVHTHDITRTTAPGGRCPRSRAGTCSPGCGPASTRATTRPGRCSTTPAGRRGAVCPPPSGGAGTARRAEGGRFPPGPSPLLCAPAGPSPAARRSSTPRPRRPDRHHPSGR
ncbi:maleylpyruvate isomerase N-terminal domain-containing protein [Pseudonocardia sp. ICBG601]|uniref:maleylpyruvate isomerase N-terminal domain-containing protein n=1 Tax=Pseudonocardia sp. ICBG601 TaxID=2846759 RepID=UPI001CF66DC5|nr:maleylpyruvate isomerase N-terminal domain-containing protein [Pseudonocardia sp. ICBG601]